MQRIELRLPKDNILFSLPIGTRSAVAATLLDVGKKLEDLEKHLLSIDHRLTDIEKRTIGPVEIRPQKISEEGEQDKIAQNIMEGFGLLD